MEKEKNQELYVEMGDILIGKIYINNNQEEKESYHNIAIEDVYA